MSAKINCDQVSWLLDLAERYLSKDKHPNISQQHEMKKYAMLYEIMDITGLDFEDDNAIFNGTPQFVNQWNQRKEIRN